MSNSNDARLANLLAAAATGLVDAIEQSMADAAGLDGAAPAALVALLDFLPGGSVRDLSRVVGLTHSGAVRLVDRLVEAGYVARGRGADARSRTVRLTRSGRTTALRVRAAREQATRQTFAPLSAPQRDRLARSCEQLVGQLTELRLARRSTGEAPAGGALCRACDFTACGRSEGHCPAARQRAAR